MPQLLIIDDSVEIHKLMKFWLKKDNFEIISAFDGQSGFKQAVKVVPDVILIDVIMPDTDGFEVCKMLKLNKVTEHIPVIFLTAIDNTIDKVKGLELGAIDYVIKPFDVAELKARINIVYNNKKLKEDLKKEKEAAEEATRLKDQFVSLVAHDLRSPFGAMLGHLELLVSDEIEPLHEDHKEILEMIIATGYQQLDMIADLLHSSRLEGGKIKVKLQLFDTHQLVEESIAKTQLLADKKHIQLVDNVPKNMYIHADKYLIQEVVQNLITNAIKFSYPESNIEITVYTDDEVVVAVKDFGVGVEESKLDNLFEPVEGKSTMGTMGEEGTGLGLMYCFDIIKAHHGTMSVVSVVGEGSTFYIHLPLEPRH